MSILHPQDQVGLERGNLTSWKCIYRREFDLISSKFDLCAKMKEKSKRKRLKEELKSKERMKGKRERIFPKSTTCAKL